MDIAAFNLFTCEELGTWQRGPERAQTATMLRAAIFSAMIALCDGDSGKKTTIIGRFGQPQTKTSASCRVLDALKGPKLWKMNFMQR